KFPAAAEQCLNYLAHQGYGAFDIFVRVGPELHAVERFARAELPESWRSRQGMLFYANVIAYHPAAVECCTVPDPAEFLARHRRPHRPPLRRRQRPQPLLYARRRARGARPLRRRPRPRRRRARDERVIPRPRRRRPPALRRPRRPPVRAIQRPPHLRLRPGPRILPGARPGRILPRPRPQRPRRPRAHRQRDPSAVRPAALRLRVFLVPKARCRSTRLQEVRVTTLPIADSAPAASPSLAEMQAPAPLQVGRAN